MQDGPSQRIWRKFKRNKLALSGLVFIAVLTLLGILGYWVMPDSSPLANDMHLQLSTKKPGRSFTLLAIRKPEHTPKVSLFTRMLSGQTQAYKTIPITSYHIKKDSIYVQEYIGDDEQPEKKAYNIFEVFSGHKPTYSNGLARFSFEQNIKQVPLTEQALKEIQNQIVSKQIIKHTFLLGTDLYGRDMLSRLLLGIRISLSVGMLAVIISLLIGVSLGAIAGYFGGRIDDAISWLMNVIWSLPALLLVIAISFALGKGFWQLFIAVGLSMWVDVARLVRGQVMGVKRVEYIEAAKALGFSNARIIIKHILPNIAGPVLVMASSNFASAILLETGLSFLGFGAQPPTPSWGGMIKEHYGYIIIDAAYLAILPGLAIMLTVYAFNLLAIGLRDAYDVRDNIPAP